MNIIEWLNTNFDAGDAIIYGFIAFVIWFILWHLINLITSKLIKFDLNYDLMNMGPILAPMVSFGIAIFASFIVILFIASIQAAIQYGTKLALPLLLFWGGFTAFVIFFIKKFKEQ